MFHLGLVLILALATIIGNSNPSNNLEISYSEMLNNAYVDYYTTIKNLGVIYKEEIIQTDHGTYHIYYYYDEGNPIAKKIFDKYDTYQERNILGSAYLLALSLTILLPYPYDEIIINTANVGHFFAALTWKDTEFFKDKYIQLTIFNIGW